MRLSYVIITWNRRKRLLETLEHLYQHTPLHPSQFEVFVVDNASTDGTAQSVAQRFKRVHLIALSQNEGMAARNHAMRAARGDYITILDDDSYPVGEAVTRSMRYMDIHPRTAAVTGRVVLPNGRLEASALPGVMIGCATTIRRAAIEQVGCFAPEFFRQAEEYDLSFRLAGAGYRVERFEDLEFCHDKQTSGRSSALTVRMDMRNNLILAHRYLPAPLRQVYAADWTQRYHAIARAQGHEKIARKAVWQARYWALRDRLTTTRTLDPQAVEQLFGLDAQAEAVAEFARTHRLQRVMISDLGKNIYATWRACRLAGLEVTGIAERNPTFAGLDYRGLAVRRDGTAMVAKPEAVILSNVNPAQVQARADQWRKTGLPVLTFWQPRTLSRVIVSTPRQRDHAA